MLIQVFSRGEPASASTPSSTACPAPRSLPYGAGCALSASRPADEIERVVDHIDGVGGRDAVKEAQRPASRLAIASRISSRDSPAAAVLCWDVCLLSTDLAVSL
jgi:hypothetical protein